MAIVNEAVCDRISERIVNVYKDESKKKGAEAVEVLCGQLLALMDLEQAMPKEGRPPSMDVFFKAAGRCLANLMRAQVMATSSQASPLPS